LSLKETENSPGPVTDSPNLSGSPAVTGFRRSRRVRFEMPVSVYFYQENANPTLEAAKTLTVSAHGALLVLSTPLALGDKLRLVNPRTQAEIECHARRFAMRYPTGVNQVGVEFVAASPTFWDVESRPLDWDPTWVPPAERKRPQAPVWTAPSGTGIPETTDDTTSEQDDTAAAPTPKRRRLLLFSTLAVLGLMTIGLVGMVISRSGSQAPAVVWIPASRGVAPEDAGLIPDSDSYRVATAADFAPESVSRLSGQQANGDIPGAYSATGSSHAYVLIGKDSTWRVLIVANGQLRCDARYRTLALVAHIPKNLIQKIDWSDRPPLEPEGDGLLVVSSANSPASGVVLFLQGDQVVTGTPFSYYQVLQSQTP
jgi:hypothetical protein